MGTPDQFDINKFNTMVNQATDAILCNADCRKQRQSDLLEQKLTEAKVNLQTAPQQYQVAEKNYVTFTQGTGAYNELRDKKLQEAADKIATAFLENFNEDLSLVNSQINTYEGLLINYRNVLDLFKKYATENAKLKKELKEEANDVLTNERKTFYEDQNIGSLKNVYFYFLLVIYIIFTISFGIFSFTFPSQKSMVTRILTFAFLLMLPFFSTWILGMFIALCYAIYNMLPKNVYAQKNY